MCPHDGETVEFGRSGINSLHDGACQRRNETSPAGGVKLVRFMWFPCAVLDNLTPQEPNVSISAPPQGTSKSAHVSNDKGLNDQGGLAMRKTCRVPVALMPGTSVLAIVVGHER